MTKPQHNLMPGLSAMPGGGRASGLPRLVVVDDSDLITATMRSIFESDHEVRVAHSGEEGLVLCESWLPDLILLDVVMFEIDGYEVCRRLKANPATREIPVIFVTGQTDPSHEAEGMDYGAVDFITKPINVKVVRARVRTHLTLRQAQQRVQALNDSLERRVEERSAALAAATQKLSAAQQDLASSEAKATLSTLVASVSHELETPLGNSMLVSSTLAGDLAAFQKTVDKGELKRSTLQHFLEEQAEGLRMMQNNIRRAEELVQNFKQVAADQASEQRRSFDLATQVREVVNVMSPKLKQQPHRVVVDIPGGIVMDSMPGPLGQVIINLINNAWLHAFEGRSDGMFTISATKSGANVLLRCFDNGVGVPEQILQRMFQPFFSTKIGSGGTGLGMTIVENLVTSSLQGTLQVKSKVGEGTSFEITLPLVLGAAKRPPTKSP